MSGDYTPIQHLLGEVDDYGIIIGLKDRIKDQLRRAYAIGFFHGGDTGEGGTRDPRGDQPDSPATGGAWVPCGNSDAVTIAFLGDNPGDDPADCLPLTREQYIAGLSEWPYQIIGDQILVGHNGQWLEVPDGTPLWKFLEEISGN